MDRIAADSPLQTLSTSRAPNHPRKPPRDTDVNEFCRIVARIVIRVLIEEAPQADNDRENA